MSWQVDSAHSSIEFSTKHMMISKVRGRFEEFEATVNLDENNPANTTVEVEVQLSSVNTKDAQRDGHLTSPDFFDVATYPIMTFKSIQVKQSDDSHAQLSGDLTIKDVTKAITLDVEYNGQAKNPFSGQISTGFMASGKINRKDWGLTWNQVLETGGILVGEQISLDINLELIKQSEDVPALETV